MAEPAIDRHLSADSNAANSKERLRTPEELVAKAIAPIKPEFLRPPPSSRADKKGENDAVAGSDSTRSNGTTGDAANGGKASSIVTRDKKSKRQLKRERREEKKSAAHICPTIAKTGEVGSCGFGDNCRFSHDLDAFLAQRPADLDWECPFVSAEARCPYGLACRFYGTHKEGAAVDGMSAGRRSSEVNGLNKDVQKLLWKNKLKFPKADSVLKSLGLMGPGKPQQRKIDDEEESDKVAVDTVEENGCGEMASESSSKMEGSVEALAEDDTKETAMDDDLGNQNGASEMVIESSDKLEGSVEAGVEGDTKEAAMADDLRPSKKAKSVVDQVSPPSGNGNGSNIADNLPDKSCSESKSELVIGNECSETEGCLKLNLREKKIIDFRGKLYLAPLTTVGNLPFRRLCKVLGADVTCGEMAMCTNLLQGQASEWALLRRHSSEDLFGVQICGAYPDTVAKTVEMIEQECTLDFIDINMGCPIDIVVNKGAGSCLLMKPMRMKGVIQAASSTVQTPITVKVRTAYFEGKNRIDSLIADIGTWGASAVTIHGRSRQQRYSKLADWDYIYQCAGKAPESLPVIGNGDIFSYVDWNNHMSDCPKLSSCMLARGALNKPWLFTEIKEQRHWDITSGERLNILKDYVRFGLEHWGSDAKGVETTRHFLLEWLSYSCRYIPVGLLEVIPQRINWRPPSYYGRDELETLMASDSAADWIRITEMLLGKVPESFTFSPKHKSNAYDRAENG